MTEVAAERPIETHAGGDRTTIYIACGLILLVFVLFARTLTSRFGFYLDDFTLARPWTWGQLGEAFSGTFQAVESSQDAYFRPLSSLSFALDWELWGTNMWGYHLTNIVLHAGATVAVFALLRLCACRSGVQPLERSPSR